MACDILKFCLRMQCATVYSQESFTTSQVVLPDEVHELIAKELLLKQELAQQFLHRSNAITKQ